MRTRHMMVAIVAALVIASLVSWMFADEDPPPHERPADAGGRLTAYSPQVRSSTPQPVLVRELAQGRLVVAARPQRLDQHRQPGGILDAGRHGAAVEVGAQRHAVDAQPLDQMVDMGAPASRPACRRRCGRRRAGS